MVLDLFNVGIMMRVRKGQGGIRRSRVGLGHLLGRGGPWSPLRGMDVSSFLGLLSFAGPAQVKPRLAKERVVKWGPNKSLSISLQGGQPNSGMNNSHSFQESHLDTSQRSSESRSWSRSEKANRAKVSLSLTKEAGVCPKTFRHGSCYQNRLSGNRFDLLQSRPLGDDVNGECESMKEEGLSRNFLKQPRKKWTRNDKQKWVAHKDSHSCLGKSSSSHIRNSLSASFSTSTPSCGLSRSKGEEVFVGRQQMSPVLEGDSVDGLSSTIGSDFEDVGPSERDGTVCLSGDRDFNRFCAGFAETCSEFSSASRVYDSSGEEMGRSVKPLPSGTARPCSLLKDGSVTCLKSSVPDLVTVCVGKDIRISLSDESTSLLVKELQKHRFSLDDQTVDCNPDPFIRDGVLDYGEDWSSHVEETMVDKGGEGDGSRSLDLMLWEEEGHANLGVVDPLAIVLPEDLGSKECRQEAEDTGKEWVKANIGVTSEKLGVSCKDDRDQALAILQATAKGERRGDDSIFQKEEPEERGKGA